MSDPVEPPATIPPTPAIAERIAASLSETDDGPRRQITRALRVLGTERVEAFVTEALEVEQKGGLWLPDRSRRRTLGGVFFHLIRQQVTSKERQRIFVGQPSAPVPAVPPPPPVLPWTSETVAEIQAGSGKATTMKLTVVGRPQQVVDRGTVVIIGLQSDRVPPLPRGVPAPIGEPTRCALLIGRKQWQQVEAALKDPEDRLIAEGYPSLAAGLEGLTVHVTRVTTVKLQSAKRPPAPS